jgi:hypothetical protein
VSDEDLAIEVAKQKLVTLKDRPGYLEAMRKEAPAPIARAATFLATAACAGIIYACTLYVTAAWLMWILIIVFGAFAMLFLLATIGLSPKLAPDTWGVAVLEKREVDGKHLIAFLRENGDRHELAVNEQIFALLRAGDLGVLRTTGAAPDFSVDSFRRL